MVIGPSEREANRFGSSRWANTDDALRAGLFEDKGLPFGYLDDQLLRLSLIHISEPTRPY